MQEIKSKNRCHLLLTKACNLILPSSYYYPTLSDSKKKERIYLSPSTIFPSPAFYLRLRLKFGSSIKEVKKKFVKTYRFPLHLQREITVPDVDSAIFLFVLSQSLTSILIGTTYSANQIHAEGLIKMQTFKPQSQRFHSSGIGSRKQHSNPAPQLILTLIYLCSKPMGRGE